MTEADRLLARFHTTLDLWEAGVGIRRQTIRRDHPSASDDEIDRLLHRWLTTRPGAEDGDGPQREPR